MRLVTIATHSEAYFPYLKQSCDKLNSNLEVLGWGEKWTGFSFKSMLIKNYLKNIEDNEIVCVIDSFDVILLRPITELEQFFKKYSKMTGVKIIIGCDKAPSPIVKSISKVQFGTCHGLFLNAGTYIGYAKHLRKLINEIYITPDLDDQVLLVKYVNKHPHLVHIDTSSLFFLTINNPTGDFIYDTNLIYVSKHKLFYRGIRPFFAHGNGNTNMIDVITSLGYKISDLKKEKIQTNRYIIQFNKVISYYYIPIFIIITALIIWFIYKSKK
jgi:hypothetical protein